MEFSFPPVSGFFFFFLSFSSLSGIFDFITDYLGFLGDAVLKNLHGSAKESAWQCRKCRRLGCHPWVGKIPWREKWQPTPVLLLGKSYGQRNHSLWDLTKVERDWAHTYTTLMHKIVLSEVTLI